MSFASRMEERDARDEAAVMDRMPRTMDISKRLTERIAATTTTDERVRWESLAMANEWDRRTGHEIDEAEYQEWLGLLGGDAAGEHA